MNWDLDSICDDFEERWRSSERPDIAHFLARVSAAERPELLRELIQIELCWRVREPSEPTEDEYLARFPKDQAVVAEAFEQFHQGSITNEKRSQTQDATQTIEPVFNRRAEKSMRLPVIVKNTAVAGERIKYFGEYELLEEIARGGMGVVFKARQLKLNRIVALKMILSGDLAGQEEVQRFKTEAEAAANLDHPGIVPIYEIGEHNGQHYFSMGFVEGQSLSERVKDGPLLPRQAAELMRKVAEAVAYAHGKGVIHRDLKPANVLLDVNGEPRVTDFGLAKQVGSGRDLTRTGAVMGTPSYMPPEQAAGTISVVDERSDVYSIGATLYAMLTGRAPFQSANAIDVLRQVVEDEPVPPVILNRQIPIDLNTICLKALQKHPAQRYDSAAACAEDLRRYLNGQPISARPIGRTQRLWKWARRNPVVSTLLASLALTLVLATAISSNFARIAETKASLATRRAAEAIAHLETANRETARADANAKRAEDEARRADARAEEAAANATIAEQQRTRADRNSKLAQQQASRAEQKAAEATAASQEAHEMLYLTRMSLVQRAYAEGRVDLVRSLLKPSGESLNRRMTSRQDLRDFEWYYWLQRCKGVESISCPRTNRGSGGSGFPDRNDEQLKQHPNGRQILSCTGITPDSRITVWNLQTRKQEFEISGEWHSPTYSRDGSLIAAYGEAKRREDSSTPRQKFVQTWDATTGVPVHQFDLDYLGWPCLLFLKGRELLAVGHSRTGVISVYDVSSGTISQEFKAHPPDPGLSHTMSLRLSPDGNLLASCSPGSPIIKFWDTTTWELIQNIRLTSTIHDFELSLDGQSLILAYRDHVEEWDVKRGQRTSRLFGVSSPIRDIEVSPDNGEILAACRDEIVGWRRDSREIVRIIPLAEEPTGFAVSIHEDVLLVRGRSAISLWDNTQSYGGKKNLSEAETGSGRPDQVLAVGDKYYVYSVGESVTLRLLNDPKGEIHVLRGHKGLVQAADLSVDDSVLVSGGEDRTVRLWDVSSRRQTHELTGHSAAVAAVALAPSGRLVASGDSTGVLVVWDAVSGEHRYSRRFTDRIKHLSYSSSGDILNVETSGEVSLRKAETGSEIVSIKVDASCQDTCVSSTGERVFVTEDSSVIVYDSESSKEVARLRGHIYSVECVECSADGKYLVSGNFNTICVWDVASLKLLHTGSGFSRGHSSFAALPAEPSRMLAFGNGVMRWLDCDNGGAGRSQAIDGRSRLGSNRDKLAIGVNRDRVTVTDLDTVETWRLDRGVKCEQLVSDNRAYSISGETVLSLDGSVFGERWRGSEGTSESMIVASEVDTGRMLFCQLTGIASSFALSWNGNFMALAPVHDEDVRIIDLTRNEVVQNLRLNETEARSSCISFAADAQLLVVGTQEGCLSVYDLASGTVKWTASPFEGGPCDCAVFDERNRLLAATGGLSGEIVLLDAMSGQRRSVSLGHGVTVRSLAFSPSGTRLASTGDDGVLRLWDTATGIEVLTIRLSEDSRVSAGGNWASHVAFAPDGSRLAATYGSNVWLFDAPRD